MQLRKGHTFVVWRLDRVGRNFRHLIEMVQDLDNRGIGFRSLDENIDTTTAMGKLMLRTILGSPSQVWSRLERRGEGAGQRLPARP